MSLQHVPCWNTVSPFGGASSGDGASDVPVPAQDESPVYSRVAFPVVLPVDGAMDASNPIAARGTYTGPIRASPMGSSPARVVPVIVDAVREAMRREMATERQAFYDKIEEERALFYRRIEGERNAHTKVFTRQLKDLLADQGHAMVDTWTNWSAAFTHEMRTELQESRRSYEQQLVMDRAAFKLSRDMQHAAFQSALATERQAYAANVLDERKQTADMLWEARQWHIYTCMNLQPGICLAPPRYPDDQQPPPPQVPQRPAVKITKWGFSKTLDCGLLVRRLNDNWRSSSEWRWHVSCARTAKAKSKGVEAVNVWFKTYGDMAKYLESYPV